MFWRPPESAEIIYRSIALFFMITQLKSVVLGKKPAEQFSAEHQLGRCCSGTVFFRHVCQESYTVLHLPTDSRVLSEDDSIVTRIEEHSWLLAIPTHIISCAPFCFFSCVSTLSLIWVFLFLLLYPSLKVKIALLTSSVIEDTDTSQEPTGSLRPHTSYALIIRRTFEGSRELVSFWSWLG